MAERFRLEKWYLDGVASDGRALIGYWSSLAWRGLAITWQSVVTYAPGGSASPSRRSAIGGTTRPSEDANGVRWSAPALDLELTYDAGAGGIAERLWDDGEGASVDWHCLTPTARMRATLPGGVPFAGIGYAERLVMTVPPWRLPLHELRWGRWCGDDAETSLVWIEWRHEVVRRWVWLDGRPVDARVSDDGIEGADFALSLSHPATLERRAFADVAAGIPGLLRVLPRSIREMQETKWTSAASLGRDGTPAIRGRSIHELVVLPLG